MSNTGKTQQPRLITTDELAILVKYCREMRQWSQEQMAEISGLSVRTIQRIENGSPSDLDSRRAIARAFDSDDIDVFSKPLLIPTEEDLKAQKEKFDREHITLDAISLSSGKQLARLVETTSMDISTPGFELTREADEAFAELIDYFREYRDFAEDYSERDKFEFYDEMQMHIDTLKGVGVSLCYATRKVVIKAIGEGKPLPATVLYVVAFPVGKEPEKFATPKSGQVGK